MSYETCGLLFTDKTRAVRYARNVANASGQSVWVWEVETQLPLSFCMPVPAMNPQTERKDGTQ